MLLGARLVTGDATQGRNHCPVMVLVFVLFARLADSTCLLSSPFSPCACFTPVHTLARPLKPAQEGLMLAGSGFLVSYN